MLPVGEQDNIFTYLLIIQVLHHLNGVELGLCWKTSHDKAINVRENISPKHLCLMMSGSQGCIFPPVGEQG